jgi:sterol desaturase/sphingolipid hydroxylase (fatty acid hydroxylase superfamily)
MHHRRLFRWFHCTHHRSTNTNPKLYPRALSRHWLGRWINTSVAHNIHHAKARYNFSWYFLFWDRVMGTLSPDYDKQYRAKW